MNPHMLLDQTDSILVTDLHDGDRMLSYFMDGKQEFLTVTRMGYLDLVMAMRERSWSGIKFSEELALFSKPS